MINLIGAFIVSLMLFGLLRERPSLSKGEARLASLPRWLQAVGILFFASLALQEALECFSGLALIAWSNTLFSGWNFWVHEAGHVYFMWGGELLHSFGGTLNEIIFPLVPAVYCLRQRLTRLFSVFIFWFAHSCFGIGRYVADARSQKMEMIGDPGSTHDWNVILGKLRLLEYDTVLGTLVTALGWTLTVVAIGIYVSTLLNTRPNSALFAPHDK